MALKIELTIDQLAELLKRLGPEQLADLEMLSPSVMRTPGKSAALVFCEEFHPDEINSARVE